MSNLKRSLLAALLGLSNFSALLLAQEPIAGRVYDGWQTASMRIPASQKSLGQIPSQVPVPESSAQTGPTSRVEQTAYYQAQGSLSDQLPPAGSLPQSAMGGSASPPNLGAGQAFPALPPSFQGGGLGNVDPGGRGNYPASPPVLPHNPGLESSGASPQRIPSQFQGGASAGSAQPLAAYGQSPSRSVAAQPSSNQPMLPAAPDRGGYQSVVPMQDGPVSPQPSMSPRATAGQSIAYQQPQSSRGATTSGLREIDGGAVLPNGRLDPNTIASGPPFVSPPPRSRYPTSPYNRAYFQTVAYQRTAAATPPSYAAPTMQLANTQLPSAQAMPPGQLLQPTTGIYPTAYQCQPTLPPGTAATYVPGTITPDLAPTVYSTNNAGLRPLFSLGQENYNVQLGRGIIGQPTVYVPRQPIRNFFRYIFP